MVESLLLKFPDGSKKEIAAAAKKAGLSVAEFCRQAIAAKLQGKARKTVRSSKRGRPKKSG